MGVLGPLGLILRSWPSVNLRVAYSQCFVPVFESLYSQCHSKSVHMSLQHRGTVMFAKHGQYLSAEDDHCTVNNSIILSSISTARLLHLNQKLITQTDASHNVVR